MEVVTLSKKLIKPYTPTPQNLKKYYLSFIDQNMPSTNIGVVLFYQSKPENIRKLEESLAMILVQFYPLAGRYIKNDHLIDCNDQGAMFVEAEAPDVELTMDLFVKNMETDKLSNLFPDREFPVADAPNPLLSIQVTHFPCGGLAIAVLVSHAVFDAASLGTFVAAWSDATNPDGKMAVAPTFDLPSLLPCMDLGSGNLEDLFEDEKIVLKRFSFDKVALTRLRSKLSPNHNGKTVSRVLAVTAIIAKALIRLNCAKHDRTRGFLICQLINMRERTMFRPQPKHVCGNMATPSLTQRLAASEAEEMGMQELVDLVGDAVEKSIADHAEILSPDRDGRDIIINTWSNARQYLSDRNTIPLSFSDWGKFGFYEADFGLGKPVSVSIRPPVFANYTALMNKDGGGIEAWVYLNRDDMHYFEQDEEIKFYTN